MGEIIEAEIIEDGDDDAATPQRPSNGLVPPPKRPPDPTRNTSRDAKGAGHGGPANGMGTASPANGAWQQFTAGPDGTGVQAQNKAQELGRARRELARETYAGVLKNYTQKIAKLHAKVIDRAMMDTATDDELQKALAVSKEVMDRLAGKPTTHQEGTTEVNITTHLKSLASRPVPELER